MNQQTKVIFLFLFLWLVNKAKGQENAKRAENTVLKIDKGENRYSKGQSKWITRNGFPLSEYDWMDEEINMHLDEALKARSNANGLGVTSIPLIFLSGIVTMAGALNEDPEKNTGYGGAFVFFLGSAMLVSSIGSAISAKKKIRHTEALRNARY